MTHKATLSLFAALATAAGFVPESSAQKDQAPAPAPAADTSQPVQEIKDPMLGTLLPGWKWIRENKAGWRQSPGGLQVLVEPGNMWGPANDAKNVLVHPIPEALTANAEVRVTVAHQPKKRWEQANLVWYYSDSSMVKLGLEIENGVLNIVMGREENDRTRTIAVLPFPHEEVELRMAVNGRSLTGSYRRPGEKEWREAGKADLPEAPGLSPSVSLQFYQGEAESGRWAAVRDFSLSLLKP